MSIAQGITHMYLYAAFAISEKDVKKYDVSIFNAER